MLEILAPAGGEEQLKAAVNAGADAVYLGFGAFNARRNAKNFDFEGLCNAVKYCHGRGVKVHAALNTLVLENELESALIDAKKAAEAGVDAVIVQDLGLAKMIHESIPALPMHASTQLTIHNKSGVLEAKRLGFSRVVLARELTLNEIKDIAQSTDIEIEVFIHGALCMCVSGGCYLSSVLGQRSGNRGLCAQPCRLDFNINNRDHALSLKDMCHIGKINELEQAGVTSVKIEGRMKRPEYVFEAVEACRIARSGGRPDMETLKKVFSRSGFTDGFLTGKRTLDMFGYRQKEDVIAAESVLRDIENKYKGEAGRVEISAEFTLKENENACFTVSDGENRVEISGDLPDKAQNRSITEADIKKQISKTGNTPFLMRDIAVSLDGGITIPLSKINAMRREGLEKLLELRSQPCRYEILPFNKPQCENKKFPPEIWVRGETREQLRFLSDECILPLKIAENCVAEIPSLVFPNDEKRIISELEKAKSRGVKKAVCNNIGAVFLARAAGLEPVGGWGLNIINSVAAAALKCEGVNDSIISFETGMGNFKSIKTDGKRALIGYGYLPLMRMRACPAQKKNGCENCRGINKITDRKNTQFTLWCRDKRYTVLLNSVPLYVGDKEKADISVLYFTLESAENAKKIYDLYKNGEVPDFERTNGLYFKTLK